MSGLSFDKSNTCVFDLPTSSCGMVALRPNQDGRIKGYTGVNAIQQRFGDCLAN